MADESHHDIAEASQESHRNFESNQHDQSLYSHQIGGPVDTVRELQRVNQTDALDTSDLKSLDVRRLTSSSSVLANLGRIPGVLGRQDANDNEELKDYSVRM